MYFCSKKRLEDKIKTFSTFGATQNGGITRYSLSKEAHQARDEFKRRMEKIGAQVYTDDLANMYAILKGDGTKKEKIVMASHLDSVKNGGNYDGVLGVLSAMEVLETIHDQNIPHHHDLVAMVWTNEEGSLYPPAMMCSAILSYEDLPSSFKDCFVEETLLNSRSVLNPNETFKDALEASPYKGDKKNRLNKKDYLAMFELHIEQGPILTNNHNDIGVVTCVLGMCNYRIKIYGESDHAGTTPMKYRKDALYAASKVLLYLHEQLDKLPKDLVYTTGEIICQPNVHTVIPSYVEFSLDARHENPDVIKEVVKIIHSLPNEVEKCRVKPVLAWERDTVYFNKTLVDYVLKSSEGLGYTHQYINSGAGHDAQMISYVLPTTMIFVPSKDGHSHCEIEHTPLENCEKGVNILLNAVLTCDKNFEK